MPRTRDPGPGDQQWIYWIETNILDLRIANELRMEHSQFKRCNSQNDGQEFAIEYSYIIPCKMLSINPNKQ